MPATGKMIETYLKRHASFHNPRTLERRVTALRRWHKHHHQNDPTQEPCVSETLSGILRSHGRPRRQALALRLADLDVMSDYLKKKGDTQSIRNRALLLVGFFGAFRRSELVSICWEHVQFENEGMVILLPCSKTDQVGEGAQTYIPFGNDGRCPVRALIEWRKVSKKNAGPIFKRISRWGEIDDAPISSNHLNRIIQSLARDTGFANWQHYSCHSLRRGFATESARLGASLASIKAHGRWRSTKTVVEYIEAGRAFSDSAVKVLFEF